MRFNVAAIKHQKGVALIIVLLLVYEQARKIAQALIQIQVSVSAS